MMDITESSGKWRVTYGCIEDCKTHEIRRVTNIPTANTLATMPLKTFQQKCQTAFTTGQWPQ
jgi:hypothetical protein